MAYLLAAVSTGAMMIWGPYIWDSTFEHTWCLLGKPGEGNVFIRFHSNNFWAIGFLSDMDFGQMGAPRLLIALLFNLLRSSHRVRGTKSEKHPEFR